MALLCFKNKKKKYIIALNTVEKFWNVSGLKLTRKKTEGMWIGKLKNSYENIANIHWWNEPIKALGIYFGNNWKSKQNLK